MWCHKTSIHYSLSQLQRSEPFGGLHTVTRRCGCDLTAWKLPASHIWHHPTQALHEATLGFLKARWHQDNQTFGDPDSKMTALRDPGRSPKASYDLASEVQKCHLHCILGINQAKIDLRGRELDPASQ